MREFNNPSAIGLDRKIIFDDEKVIFKTTQDEKPIISANKAFQAIADGYTSSRNMQHVARVPVVVIEQWLTESGLKYGSREFMNLCTKKLNDPEYVYLRTGLGKLREQ